MLNPILTFILKQRMLMLMLGGLVLLLGGMAWMSMPIDAFPDVTNVQVMILAEAQGLSPAEVERGACEFEHMVAEEITESICILLGHSILSRLGLGRFFSLAVCSRGNCFLFDLLGSGREDLEETS